MKKIFRLTESELHHIVRETANKVISRALTENEVDGKLCKIIADRILESGEYVLDYHDQDENVEYQDIQIGKDAYASVTFDVIEKPTVRMGMKSHDYDVPDDPPYLDGDTKVEVTEIYICDFEANDDGYYIQDNGMVGKAIEDVIVWDGYGEEDYDDDSYGYNEY